MSILFRIVVVLLWAGTVCSGISRDQHEFIKSFIDHYDFNAEGRYAHEYHPYLLKKTAESFSQLEARLQHEGFNLHGRTIIAGYEGGAIPSYFTDFRATNIDDEASSKSSAGWSLQLHNCFGLMTGFLLKDINFLARQYYGGVPAVFEHINADRVEIFHDYSGLIQEHAFKDTFQLMRGYREMVEKKFKTHDAPGVFTTLAQFWQALYESQLKMQGQMLAGTQDILFSIAYADYLGRSSLPCMKYYTGGDITYPIETFIGQSIEATKNAQDFVAKFVPTMQPINGEKTVYVFCSFVDGVGKSTMLGNVQNYSKHGTQVSTYDRVDNSSSQYANVFSLSDHVYIADLPAQVSHFTYKPDGMVYVPVESEVTREELAALQTYVQDNWDEIFEQFKSDVIRTQEILKQEGFFASALNDSAQPHLSFIKNILLLKKYDLAWVPFVYEGTHYLVNSAHEVQMAGQIPIRVLCPLSAAPSAGLKNIESEQMLFYEGVRFPLPYQEFLDNLVQQLKEAGVTQVVFVDFLSMYPRSSRENIRINYLLQQMALLIKNFNVNNSLYKNFVSPAELYANLLDHDLYACMSHAYVYEVLVRLCLYRLLDERVANDLTGVSLRALTDILYEQITTAVDDSALGVVRELCKQKFGREFKELKHVYGLTKEFVNVHTFSFSHLYSFSRVLQEYFSKQCGHGTIMSLWSGLESEVTGGLEQVTGYVDQEALLEDQTPVRILYEFPLECRSVSYLGPFMQTVRSAWYASLANLLYSHDGRITYECWQVPPMIIKARDDGHAIYLVQKSFAAWSGDNEPLKQAIPGMHRFNTEFRANSSYMRWGELEGMPYCLDWDPANTNQGVYAFNADLHEKDESLFSYKSPVTELVLAYQKEHGADKVMPASMLYEELHDGRDWDAVKRRMLQQAHTNGPFPFSVQNGVNGRSDAVLVTTPSATDKKIYIGRDEQRAGAQLLVVALATLEMILKDPQSDVVVRFGNKKDFVAALKLFEEVTLPKHFNILFTEPLFDNYEDVEPLIGWEAFGVEES